MKCKMLIGVLVHSVGISPCMWTEEKINCPHAVKKPCISHVVRTIDGPNTAQPHTFVLSLVSR